MKKLLVLCFLSLLFVGCDKPNPHPETLDPIYNDVTKRAEELKKAVEADRKALEDAQKEFDAVKPQTGQNLYAKKRLLEAETKLNTTIQMQKYYEIKSESRLQSDQAEYLKAYSNKEPWPDPKEYKQFLELERIQSKKLSWSVADRMMSAGVAPKAKKPDEKKEAQKEGRPE